MKFKDLISVISFLRKAKGCVIMKDDINRLEVSTFGIRTYPVAKCEDVIMHSTFKDLENDVDLEEAASEYVREDFHERSRADFKAGAKWKEQQMMKNAVEGNYWIGEIHLDTSIIQGYDDGDRIKFIPIKYEQQ